MWKWPRLQIVFPPQVYSPLIWCHLPRSFWDAAAAHTKLFKRLHSLAKGWAGLSVSTLQSGHPDAGSAMGLGDSPELGHSGLTWRVNWSDLIVTWKWCLWEQSCFALLCCQTNLGSKPLWKSSREHSLKRWTGSRSFSGWRCSCWWNFYICYDINEQKRFGFLMLSLVTDLSSLCPAGVMTSGTGTYWPISEPLCGGMKQCSQQRLWSPVNRECSPHTRCLSLGK